MSDVETAPTGAIAAPAENTAASPEQTQDTTPQESAPATTDEQDEQARDEKGRFVQKRINELTRKYHDERRAREQESTRLRELESELARYRNPPPDPQQDLPAYLRHVAREEAAQFVEAQRGEDRQRQEQTRLQTIASEYQARETEYAKTHPEYAEAAETFVSIAGGEAPQIAEVLMTSEHGPAVVHYLGTHLDEAARILQMPAHLAAAALARVEARVSPKAKPVSSAPNPPPTLGGGKATVTKNPDEMPQAEWLVWRNSQL